MALESRGSFCSWTTAAWRSSSGSFMFLIVSRSSLRLAAYLADSARRRLSFSIMDRLAMLAPQRKIEGLEQRSRLRVVLGAGDDGDVQSTHRVDFVEIDLRKNNL